MRAHTEPSANERAEAQVRSLTHSWAASAKSSSAAAKLNAKVAENRRRLAERRRELEGQMRAKLDLVREISAKEAAQTAVKTSWRGLRNFQRSFFRALQAEHTIVAAVAPSVDNLSGDKMRDENIVHIFFLTMMSELCVLCMLRGGAEVPVFSLTTVINSAISTSTCAVLAMMAKRVFRFGNKIRWRRKDKQRESAAALIQRRFRQKKKERKRQKGVKARARRCVKGLLRRLLRCCWRILCASCWRRLCRCLRRKAAVVDNPNDKYNVKASRGKVKPAKQGKRRGGGKRPDSQSAAAAKPSLKSMLMAAAAPGAVAPGKITSFGDLVKTKQREEHAMFGRFPLTASQLSGKAAARWVTMHPKLHLFRFCLAWGINVAVYVLACLVALVYGVTFQAPAFTELLLAWLAGLIFTWAVIEPSEVLGLVLFPSLANSGPLAACRDKCKAAGFY